MKSKILFFFICIIFITGCNNMKNVEEGKSDLMNVDREFSKMSIEKGIFTAFKHYADDNATIYRDGQHPYTGRDAIIKLMKNSKGVLKWEPSKAEIAESGDLGYTLGKYEYTGKTTDGEETKSNGYYVSIWKKNKDGSWKYVFDSGITAPEEIRD